jgi:rare lipoprotein A
MIKYFLSGWTTKGLTTACGTLLFLGGFLHSSVASNPTTQSVFQEQLSLETPTSPQTASSSTTAPGQSVPTDAETPVYPSITSLQSHTVQGKPALILRVRNIPVLTFLGVPGDRSSNPSQPAPTPSQAFLRADALANRVNQLAQDPQFDATQIRVGWNKQIKAYSVTIGEEVLFSLDKLTVLPETNRSRGSDALQATNRLRRLMGNAAPLKASEMTARSPQSLSANISRLPVRTNTVRGGIASWYGPGFHGRQTANGERFNQNQLTAAHRSLPFNTKVRVTNMRNGQSVVVRINDRGPFTGGRVIDLSAGAAKSIGVFSSGVAPVQLEVLLP